ncbi:MAG: hypothetical protein LC802_02590 [Acidobacteria bacterium]|nr:hypothetical protein [Acidobacteriota bacterium]
MSKVSHRPLVVVNPCAARARRAWERVRSVLEQHGIGFDVNETTAAGEGETRVRDALREGYLTVASVGGDGTLSEVVRGFFECAAAGGDAHSPPPLNPAAALAILPAGTGDDFARGLTGRRAPLEEWAERLVAHCRADDAEETTRPLDALYVTASGGAGSFVCLNAATLGISANVVTRVGLQTGAVRRLPGEARFAWAAVGAIAAWRNRRVRITVDDQTIDCATNLLAVVNGQFVGGGMWFVPSARPDDGFLDVIVACDITRTQAVRELARIHRGGHLANPKVVLKRGVRARVETLDPAEPLVLEADGDVRGQTPAEFRLMPGALRLVW